MSGVEGFVEKFTLKDGNGDEHQYVCHLLDPIDGAEVVRQVQHRLTPAVFPILYGLAGNGGTIDLSEASRDLSDALFGEGSSELIRKLINTCYRDGAHLSKDDAYRTAYRQNFYEPQRAAMEVLRVNQVFPPPAISGIWNAVMEMMGQLDLAGKAEAAIAAQMVVVDESPSPSE